MNTEFYEKIEYLDQKVKDALLYVMQEVEQKTKIISIGRSDFDDLKQVVMRLADAQESTDNQLRLLIEAQARTEVQMKHLAQAQAKSTEAQAKTEAQLNRLTEAQAKTEVQLSRLTEAQAKTEVQLNRLTESQAKTEVQLNRLTEAQAKTEAQLNRLTESQAQTDVQIINLTAAQNKTEEALLALVADHGKVKKQLGGLSMNVGYGLEDKLMPHLRAFGLTEFGITVSRVDRRYILYPDDKHDEVNMYCEGVRDDKPVFLIGEGKAQPGKKDFDAFNKKLKRLQAQLEGDVEAFMVGYQFAPTVARYADSHYPQIRRFKTFQIMTYG